MSKITATAKVPTSLELLISYVIATQQALQEIADLLPYVSSLSDPSPLPDGNGLEQAGQNDRT